jgi:hypothetical protein
MTVHPCRPHVTMDSDMLGHPWKSAKGIQQLNIISCIC